MNDPVVTAATNIDRRLPALERALDAAAMRPLLGDVLGDRGAVSVSVLKHAPGKRCVLAYGFEDGTRVIGKMYRGERVLHHAALLAELNAVLRGTTRVPRYLGRIERLGLVLQEWVAADPVPEYAAWTAADAERMGAALAALHAAPVALAPAADLAAHERRTCHPGFAALAAALPEVAADIDAVRGAIRSARVARGGRVTCHGDFGPRAAFAAGATTWLVDLDGVCRSDPAFDVAGVRVGLEAHRDGDARALGDTFLAAYRGAGGAAVRALHVHEAFWDLRRAAIAWRKQPSGWREEIGRCLVRARARF